MNPKLRWILQALCLAIWIGALWSTIPDHLWPESLTRLLWAKAAIIIIALASLWAAWLLSPDRPRTWQKSRAILLMGLVTVAGLGCGVSSWAWESVTVQWSYLVFVGLCCVTHQFLCWRSANPLTA